MSLVYFDGKQHLWADSFCNPNHTMGHSAKALILAPGVHVGFVGDVAAMQNFACLIYKTLTDADYTGANGTPSAMPAAGLVRNLFMPKNSEDDGGELLLIDHHVGVMVLWQAGQFGAISPLAPYAMGWAPAVSALLFSKHHNPDWAVEVLMNNIAQWEAGKDERGVHGPYVSLQGDSDERNWWTATDAFTYYPKSQPEPEWYTKQVAALGLPTLDQLNAQAERMPG